jgi:hypothetical protein
MNVRTRLKNAVSKSAKAIRAHVSLRASPWLVLALINCIVMAFKAPWQLGVLSWKLSGISLAAYLGYWFDRSFFPYARPHKEKEADQTSFYVASIRRALIVIGVVIAFMLAGCAAHAEGIPAEAQKYHRALRREAQIQFGLVAPTARLAAQIHQESRWRTDASSPVGAQGLAQFLPSTACWIVAAYPAQFDAGAAPYSPEWSLRAIAVYDRLLYDQVSGRTECDKWWFALRSYNGGVGHIKAEAQRASDPLSHEAVDAVCGAARRSAKYCPENLGYPRRILLRWEPLYLRNGWEGHPVCGEQRM